MSEQLNARMWEGFTRQRRNLILLSVVLAALSATGARVTKIDLVVAELDGIEQLMLMLMLWLATLYAHWRFLQFRNELPRSETHKNLHEYMEHEITPYVIHTADTMIGKASEEVSAYAKGRVKEQEVFQEKTAAIKRVNERMSAGLAGNRAVLTLDEMERALADFRRTQGDKPAQMIEVVGQFERWVSHWDLTICPKTPQQATAFYVFTIRAGNLIEREDTQKSVRVTIDEIALQRAFARAKRRVRSERHNYSEYELPAVLGWVSYGFLALWVARHLSIG